MSKNKLYLVWGAFFFIIFFLLFFLFKDYFISKQQSEVELYPTIYIQSRPEIDFLVYEETQLENISNKELAILDEGGNILGVAWFDQFGTVQNNNPNLTLLADQHVTIISSFENLGTTSWQSPKICTDIEVLVNAVAVGDVVRSCVDDFVRPQDIISMTTEVQLPTSAGTFEIHTSVPYFLMEYGDNEILTDDVLSLSGSLQ